MWFLAIIITVLAHQPTGKPRTERQTVSLAYETQYACDAALGRIDPGTLLDRYNDLLKHRGARKWALSLRADCVAQTDGRSDRPDWDFGNRMYRP